MNEPIAALMTELCSLVKNLGKNGGHISPSVYDTAQVLRLYPSEDYAPALTWLLAQQQPDGGWESPAAPYSRDVPTLAALLALHAYREQPMMRDAPNAIEAGLAFLRRQASQWAEIPIDALPIAAEVVLPYLVEIANSLGFALNRQPYAPLYQLGKHKVQQVQRRPLQPGTPPTHSWEALGMDVDSLGPDHSGGIGHSPAATAAWLRLAEQCPDLGDPCAGAANI